MYNKFLLLRLLANCDNEKLLFYSEKVSDGAISACSNFNFQYNQIDWHNRMLCLITQYGLTVFLIQKSDI